METINELIRTVELGKRIGNIVIATEALRELAQNLGFRIDGVSLITDSTLQTATNDAIESAMANNEKIMAIKLLREAVQGTGLKEAKDEIDRRWAIRYPNGHPRQRVW